MLLALALRLYNQGNSFDVDELLTLRGASQPIADVLTHRLYPVLYAIEYFFLYFGESEFVLRLPSVIAGVLCVPAMYVLGKMAYGRNAGLLAAFLVATSSYHVYHSQIARYYAMVMLLSIVLNLLMVKWIETEKVRYGLLFAIAGLASTFTQVTSAPYVLSLLLIGIGYAAVRQGSHVSANPIVRILPYVLFGLLIFAPVGVVAIARGSHTLFGIAPAGVGSEAAKPVDIRGSAYDFTLSVTGYVRFVFEYLPQGPVWVTAGLALLSIVGLATLWTHKRVWAVLIVAQFIVPPLPLFVIPVSHWYESKYFCNLLPLSLVLLSVGSIRSVEYAAALLGRRRGRGRLVQDPAGAGWGRRAGSIAVAVLLPVVALDLATYYRNREFVDWKRLAAFMAPRLHEGDVLAHTGIEKRKTEENPSAKPEYSRGNPVLNYYLEKELARADPQHAESMMASLRRVQAGTADSLKRSLRRFPDRRIWSIAAREHVLDGEIRQLLANLPARETATFEGCTARLLFSPAEKMAPK